MTAKALKDYRYTTLSTGKNQLNKYRNWLIFKGNRTTNHSVAINGLSNIASMLFILQEVMICCRKVVNTVRSYNTFNDTHDSFVVGDSCLTDDSPINTIWHLYKATVLTADVCTANSHSCLSSSEYPAMGEHPLLLEWHGSATVSRSTWKFVEGFLKSIDRLLWSDCARQSIPVCHSLD